MEEEDVPPGTIRAAMWRIVNGDPGDALQRYEITTDDMQKTSDAVIQTVIADSKKIGGAASIIGPDDLMFIFMLGVFTGANYQEDRTTPTPG